MIIREMFHGSITLNSVLLLMTFVSGFRLELMYISHIISMLPKFIEITFLFAPKG